MSFFRVIVPNYNNGEWLKKCVESVLNQTFKDYDLIVVDDCSDDNSREYLQTIIGKALVFSCHDKHYNGGSRNIGIDQLKGLSDYTLFLDSDDWFVDNNVFQELHDFIIDEEHPDCVRLPYICEYEGNKHLNVQLTDSTLEGLTASCFVACWTKCIKSDLVQKFPENTLMEDVVQHIKQCDVIKEVVPFNKPVVVHNGNNKNSCSRKENQDLQHGKWQSSMFRYMADLLDLQLTHDYCEKARQARCEGCLKNIRNGVYSQTIIK